MNVSDQRAMHSPLEPSFDFPARLARGVIPRPVGDDDRPRRDPTSLTERAADQLTQLVAGDLRLPTVGRVENNGVGSPVTKRQGGGVAVNNRHLAVELVGFFAQRRQILLTPAGHLPLRVDADHVAPDESGFQQQTAGATHRIDDRRLRPGTRDIHQCPSIEWGHTPWLDERPIRGSSLAIVTAALDGEPAEKTAGVALAVSIVSVAFLVARIDFLVTVGVAREQHTQFVVGIVEIDPESTVDENATESPFGGLRAHPSLPTHVAGANCDRSFAVETRGSECGFGSCDVAIASRHEVAGSVGVGELSNPLRLDPAGGCYPTGGDLDGTRGTGGFAGGEGVLVAGEFEAVHAQTQSQAGYQRVGLADRQPEFAGRCVLARRSQTSGMALSTAEIGWWVAAVLTYGVGDYLTTVVAVRRYSVVEANPVVTRLLSAQPGPVEFGVLKLATLLLCYLGFLAIANSPLGIWLPAALTVLGVVVTLSNLRAITDSRSD